MNIRTLCLGILYFGEATGYEINKMASEGRFSHFVEASYGSIYPALGKLTDDGLVTWREEAQAGKPSRKVYQLTDTGHKVLIEALHDVPRADIFKSEFLFICLYAQHFDSPALERLIDDRVALLEAEIERLQNASGCCDHAGSRFTKIEDAQAECSNVHDAPPPVAVDAQWVRCAGAIS